MAYDGMYGELSTRGTTNEILTEVLEVQTEIDVAHADVVELSALTNSNAALASASASTASINAGQAAASATQAGASATQATNAATTAVQAAADAVTNSAAALVLANAANTKSDAAVATANSASTTANGIDAKATTALSNSSTALTNSNAAVTTANGVDAKATQAQTDAAAALVAANSANTRTTTDITEGTNQYFTQNRVRATAMTGLVTTTNSPALAADTLVVAMGKAQAQINDRYTIAQVDSTISSRSVGTNRLMNSAFILDQRAAAPYALSSGIGNKYSNDRWVSTNAGATGSNFNIQSATLAHNGAVKQASKVTVQTAGSSVAGTNYIAAWQQYIEGFNCYDLKGQQVTLSFVMQSSVTGTFSAALQDGGSTYSCVKTFNLVANTPTKIVLVFPAIPAGATILPSSSAGMLLRIGALQTGSFATASTGSWLAGNFICATGSTMWSGVTGATLYLTEVQLEAGAYATAYEYKATADEFQACCRYYRRCRANIGGYAPAGVGNASCYPLYPGMRATPTLVFAATGPANVSVYDVRNPTPLDVTLYAVATNATASGWAVVLDFLVDAEF